MNGMSDHAELTTQYFPMSFYGENHSQLNLQFNLTSHIDEQSENVFWAHRPGICLLLVCAYTLVFVIGLIGNSFVVAAVWRCPKLHTSTNIFIVNLAVADIFVIIFCLPSNLISSIVNPWILGRFMCKTVTYVQGVSVSASVNSLVVVSLDRYLAICCGMKFQMSKTLASIIVFIIWLISILIMLPWFLFFELNLYGDHLMCAEMWPSYLDSRVFFLVANILFCYLLPLTLITCCYLRIWLKVSRRKIPINSMNEHVLRIHQRSKFKTVKMFMIVVLMFTLSWLPLYIIASFAYFDDAHQLTEWLELYLPLAVPVAQWMGNSNSCINPILYTYLNRKYREAFRALLDSHSCCGPIHMTSSSVSSALRHRNYCFHNNRTLIGTVSASVAIVSSGRNYCTSPAYKCA